MRASITAILVIRQGGEQLIESLTALTTQTRAISRLILVDSSADSTLGPKIDTVLEGAGFPWNTASVPYSTRFAHAIEAGMATAFGGDTSIPNSEWVWLLRDDSTPNDVALERLAGVVEGAPLIKIAGPKQRMSDQPGVIREMGETMTRFGERMAFGESERDQAQYDRLSDVLAVGEVGMLVNASILREIGGFDPGLSPLDGGLDLCVRARLAGHRVVVEPQSVVHVAAGPAEWSARKKLSGVWGHFLARRAWLYRRLVYAPLWLVPVLLVWIFPWGLARAGAQLLLKRPDRMTSEVLAALGALAQLGSILRARGVLSAHRVTTWATIDSLRLDPTDVREQKRMTKEELLAKEEERAAKNPEPTMFPALPWLVLTLTAISGLVFGRWWGAEVLQGGGLVPLAENGAGLWDNAWALPTLDGATQSTLIPADPASVLFAFLGTMTFWNPNLALVVLFVTAIPFAGAIAWWGFSQVLSKAWTTTLVAFLWGVSPPLLLALAHGRVGAVLSLLALPWLLGTLITAHESWQRVGQASLATVVVTASTPSLWPVVVLAVVVVALSRLVSHPVRMVAGVIPVVVGPAVVLFVPRFFGWWDQVDGRWWKNWGVLFADPGHASSFSQAPWWSALLGWPELVPESLPDIVGVSSGTLAVLLFAMGTLLTVLALSSLAFAQARASLVFGLLVAMGLVAATVAPSLFSGFQGADAVFVWPGVAVGVLVLGILVGAGSVLERPDFRDSSGNALRGFGAGMARIAGVALVISGGFPPGLMAVQAWSGNISVQPAAAPRTLPALVAAEAAQSPLVGTLVITATEDAYLLTLERGAGMTLMESSTLLRGRDIALLEGDKDLARLAATLVRPSAADPSLDLEKYGISFVLLRDSPDSEAALALAQKPELVRASSVDLGQLWQVKDSDSAIVAPQPAEVGRAGRWFLGLLAVATILSVPTERRPRGMSRPIVDGASTLGEET